MSSAQDIFMTLKNLGELVILWIRLLKDYSNYTINSSVHGPCKKDMNEENVESVENELYETRRKLEILKKMETDILETTSQLIRNLEGLEGLLNKFMTEINRRKSSYGEVVVQAFETLPENKKLACFIAFMDTVEKFQEESRQE